MKKLLALLLVVACMFSVVACGDNSVDGDVKEKAETNLKEAEETVESFMKAYCDFDFDKAAKYLSDDSELLEAGESLNAEEVVNDLPAELSAYKDDFKDVFEAMIDKMKAEIEYEITDVKEDDDEVIVAIEVVAPTENEDAINEFTSNLGEQFNENTVTDMVMELYNSGVITDSSTQQEVLDLVMAKLIESAKAGIKDMNIETETKEIEIKLSKEDDEWIIDADSIDDLIKLIKE